MNHPEPGAEIHYRDPFATAPDQRSPARRLRGRLAAPVTLWTAVDPGDGTPAGLTVSSTVLADGEPARLIGLLDEESDLWEVLRESRRFTVAPLGPAHRQLADRFAGLMPAPGGPFTGVDWRDTPYGPVHPQVTSWAGCRLDDARPYGWSMLIEATVESVTVTEEPDPGPLLHYRGRYRELTGPSGAATGS